MNRMTWAELQKMVSSNTVRVAVGLLLFFICFSYWQTAKNVQSGLWLPDLLTPQRSVTYTLALLATVGPMFIGVIGAWCCGQEFSFRTWPELLTHGASRSKIWLVKVVSVFLTVLICMLLALGTGYLSSLTAVGQVMPMHLDARTMSQFLAVFFELIFWALAALTASLALRGTGAGALVVLALPLLESVLWSSALRTWLPVWNQRAVNGALFGTGPLGMVSFFSHPDYPPVGQAILVLAIGLLIMMAMSYHLLRRAPWL